MFREGMKTGINGPVASSVGSLPYMSSSHWGHGGSVGKCLLHSGNARVATSLPIPNSGSTMYRRWSVVYGGLPVSFHI